MTSVQAGPIPQNTAIVTKDERMLKFYPLILELHAMTDLNGGEIMLLEENTGDLIIKKQAIKGDFLEKPPPRLQNTPGQRSGICFEVLKTRTPYLCPDVPQDRYYLALSFETFSRTWGSRSSFREEQSES